ncbi:MAG: hypothetical protein H6725_06815 [Sandaracinaceae bacterium]|nr:hypothetical protein [Sandaracinaceae bacterium]
MTSQPPAAHEGAETLRARRALRLDYGLLALAVAAHITFWFFGTSDALLDVDVANLTYGMVEFNLAHFNPHPPGYLLYVLALRGLHVLLGGGDTPIDRVHTAQVLSLLFALATVWQAFAGARRLYARAGAAGWAALVVALHPILLFHSIDAQTHTSEAFAAAWLLRLAVEARARPSTRSAIALGLVLALGAGFRPSFVLFGIPLVVLTFGRAHFRELVIAGAVSAVGAAAWFVPTIVMSGGYAMWSAATHALVQGAFINTSSPLAGSSLGILILANDLALAVAVAQIFLPPLAGWLLLRSGGGRLAARTQEIPRLGYVVAAICLIPIVYYALTFFSEPGYILTCVPVVALLIGGLGSGPRGHIPPAAAALLTIASGLIPQVPVAIKVASVDSWLLRHDLVHVSLRLLRERVPADARVLFISDFPDITVARQMPMHLPNVDVLLISDDDLPWHPTTSFAYVTRDDSVPIPSSHLLSNSGSRELRVDTAYDALYLDEMVSPATLRALATQSRCPIPRAIDTGAYLLLPPACLVDQALTIDGVTFGFRRVSPTATPQPGATP